MARGSLQVFVLGHESSQLRAIPNDHGLYPVDLRDLGLPDELSGNALAENRFFLSDRASQVGADYVGVVSASHDAKYACTGTLPLADLGHLRRHLAPHRVFAPLPVRGGYPEPGWVTSSDDRHPGMTDLVRDARLLMPYVDTMRTTLMANSFIASRAVYLDFLQEWRRVFHEFQARYGFDLPFSYRCPGCGAVSHDGSARYGRDRHPGSFYERVTALYYSRRDLDVRSLNTRELAPLQTAARDVLRVGHTWLYRSTRHAQRALSNTDPSVR